MPLTELCRIGRDAELRTVGDSAVVNLSLAFDYYDPKAAEKKRSTTWIEGALWGAQATRLEQYLTKGKQVFVTLTDIHLETYQGRSGEGTKLVGRITEIKLAGGVGESSGSSPAPAPAPRPAAARPAAARAPAAPATTGGVDDMDDDIPFN